MRPDTIQVWLPHLSPPEKSSLKNLPLIFARLQNFRLISENWWGKILMQAKKPSWCKQNTILMQTKNKIDATKKLMQQKTKLMHKKNVRNKQKILKHTKKKRNINGSIYIYVPIYWIIYSCERFISILYSFMMQQW